MKKRKKAFRFGLFGAFRFHMLRKTKCVCFEKMLETFSGFPSILFLDKIRRPASFAHKIERSKHEQRNENKSSSIIIIIMTTQATKKFIESAVASHQVSPPPADP
jgi:uncharacterized protein (DUF1800 family)